MPAEPATTRTKSKKKKKSKKAAREQPSRGLLTAALSMTGTEDADYDQAKAFDEWASYLTSRKRVGKANKLLSSSFVESVGWLVPYEKLAQLQLASHFRSHNSKKKKTASPKRNSLPATSDSDAEQWLATLDSRDSDLDVAFDALAWCHALPDAAGCLSRELWVEVFDSLCDLASQGSNVVGSTWSEQLIFAELPLTLAWQFPEIDRCAPLASRAAPRLSANIVNLLDGQGMIRGSELPVFGEITACWTRCFALMKDLRGVKASKDARAEYDWMIRNVLRMVRFDGQLTFAAHNVASGKPEPKRTEDLRMMIKCALRMTEDDEDIALAKLTLDEKCVSPSRLPEGLSFHSEWSAIGLLRSGWNPRSPRLSVDFSQLEMKVELQSAEKLIFSTTWTPDVLVNENLLAADSKDCWDSVCWFSDDASDYLELELELTDGWKLQRQFLLGREDGFLFASDNLMRSQADDDTTDPPRLAYRLTLPLPPTTTVIGEEESRERVLRNKKRVAVVLPLSLPEWRSDSGCGEFWMDEDCLRLEQKGQGRGLNACLFFDLNADRFEAPLTWRHLTVADTRRIVARDEAVGYRIQIGAAQWLAYRSLVGPANRTLLGQNFASDFQFARLSTDGEVETLIEIE